MTTRRPCTRCWAQVVAYRSNTCGSCLCRWSCSKGYDMTRGGAERSRAGEPGTQAERGGHQDRQTQPRARGGGGRGGRGGRRNREGKEGRGKTGRGRGREGRAGKQRGRQGENAYGAKRRRQARAFSRCKIMESRWRSMMADALSEVNSPVAKAEVLASSLHTPLATGPHPPPTASMTMGIKLMPWP